MASTAGAIEAADDAYLADLFRRANEAKLSDDRYWHLLLHYRQNLTGGYTSEQDDTGLLLASNVKTDPRAELEATRAQVVSAESVGRSRQPAQCSSVGYFSTIPYYLKVQEYRDIENRDIWEYRLNFSDGQIRRMLMHAWELGNASFDYYFFKENCSYHLLSLLEVADPSLSLTDRFLFWTVPADTVRLITQQPVLV